VKTIGLSFIIFVTAGCYSIDNETSATSDFSSNLLKIEDISLSILSDAKIDYSDELSPFTKNWFHSLSDDQKLLLTSVGVSFVYLNKYRNTVHFVLKDNNDIAERRIEGFSFPRERPISYSETSEFMTSIDRYKHYESNWWIFNSEEITPILDGISETKDILIIE